MKMRRVIFVFLAAWGEGGGGGRGGGGALPDFFLFFPCSADHERYWPPCKIVVFGLVSNTLNVRNINNNMVIPCRVDNYKLTYKLT